MKLYIDNKEVEVKSVDTDTPFKIHPNDIEFIETDVLDNGAENGELEIIVDEGLITVNWQIIK